MKYYYYYKKIKNKHIPKQDFPNMLHVYIPLNWHMPPPTIMLH